MQTVHTLSDLRATITRWRAAGQSVALVPTMGALHNGHLALVREAKKHAQRVVVSIFVNPTQFGPNEDFSRYPRPIDADIATLTDAVADVLWLPTIEEMYPHGFATSIRIEGITEMMDGIFRPGHFDGVATVVAKLLLQVTPDVALFGEKDYQQLCLIKRLASDLNINTSIIGVPTVREADGLAMSSRNQYLSAEEREIAAKIYATMVHIASQIRVGSADVKCALEEGVTILRTAGFKKIDYLELRTENDLATLEEYQPPARLLVAAWLGNTRLIDNIKVE